MWLILLVIIILLIIVINYHQKFNLKEPFINDYLIIASDADIYNETYPKRFISAIQIGRHAKLDHQGRIETLTIEPPLPELGETVCNRVTCPPYLKDIYCWKCK